MDSFLIQCTTCGARLKVHDPSLIGDIIECPKCGSFVEVLAPAGWQGPAAQPATPSEKTAAGKPNSSAKTTTGGKTTTAAKTGAAPDGAAAKASNAASTFRGTKGVSAASGSQPSLSVGGKASLPTPTAGSTPPPPPLPGKSLPGKSLPGKSLPGKSLPGKQSTGKPSTGRAPAHGSGVGSLIVPDLPAEPGLLAQWIALGRTHLRLLAATGLGLTLAAVTAWAVFGRSAADHIAAPETELAVTDSAVPPDASIDAAQPHETADPATDTSDPAPTAGVTDAATAESAHTATPAAGQTSDTAPSRAAADIPPTNGAATSGAVPPVDAATSDSASAAEDDLPVIRKRGPSRPGFDPIAQALATESDPLGATNPGAAPSRETGAPADPSDAMPDARPDDGAGPSTAADDPGADFDAVKQARLIAHLRDKVPPMEFKDAPLGSFVTFLSELSTIPITLDEPALLTAGKGARTKISVKSSGGTVEDVLKAALSRPGLLYHVGPKGIVITASPK